MQYTQNSRIADVIADPSFGEYGRLIFPLDDHYYSGEILKDFRLTYYNHIDPDKTVEIVNYMKDHADIGDTIFYEIYSEEEKQADPSKEDTGLFFFKGNPGERFALCNAGGAFAFVGAMHDSFPHALELSKKGYNAFALIYRPGVYAFHARQIGEYLLLKTPFVFFDFNEPLVFFFLDYLAVMGLFVCSGHYLAKVLRKGISNIK